MDRIIYYPSVLNNGSTNLFQDHSSNNIEKQSQDQILIIKLLTRKAGIQIHKRCEYGYQFKTTHCGEKYCLACRYKICLEN